MFVWSFSLTKHCDIDQYIYSGYCIGFDIEGTFSFGNGVATNWITFGVDMSSFTMIDNKKKIF